ncbi:MAG: bifunctional glutamate N-acetyltransferase/amino-acid acetyltransferase ArgJ [Chloroflexi bacterium]|nr:bifunctional glutamate N-acetyltransferase/amino-acid acetyltransferase ArgJ [Chloroflexota bacterium]
MVNPIENGSITSVPGFRAAGVSAGIKRRGGPDLALVVADQPSTAAAVFTTNAFKAAPVIYNQSLLAANPAGWRAVAINSGCANACTGDQGHRDAQAMAQAVADALAIRREDVMVMSTGVIGQLLPMDKILHGITLAHGQLSADIEGGHDAARAIMTTDTRPKECACEVSRGDLRLRVGGMAKGSGMIHPNMATMLGVITSNARLTPALAQRALREAVDDTLNAITVDGDTSTNDTLLLVANGSAEMSLIEDAETPAYHAFLAGLRYVATELAKDIVRDGEGATHFIEVRVEGAPTRAEAKQVAMSIAKSSLVKTAIYGQDANWGRIICAVGYSGVAIDPNRVSVWLDDLELVRSGAPYNVDEERASAILARTDIPIRVDLGIGAASATVWTCDLTHKYVDINARYRT